MLKINDIYDMEGTKKEIYNYFVEEFNNQCIDASINFELKLNNLYIIIKVLEELRSYKNDDYINVIFNEMGKWEVIQLIPHF